VIGRRTEQRTRRQKIGNKEEGKQKRAANKMKKVG
jgi:hypothetical protein